MSKIITNAKEFYANKGSQGNEKTDQNKGEVRENNIYMVKQMYSILKDPQVLEISNY